MKHVKALFILVLSLPVLASCGGGDEPGPTNLCTITFNPNGGQIVSGSPSIQVESGTEFGQCSTPTVRQEGKTFECWTFDAEGTNRVEPAFKINQNITFYARLIDEYHTVIFNENEGHFVGSPQTTFTVVSGTTLNEITIPNATDDSSAYVGWATDKNGNNSVTKDYRIDSDITLYAQYSNSALVVDNPEDSEILCYGSTAIGYHLYDLDKTVIASSSNSGMLNVSVDSAHSSVIVDAANRNVAGSANITVGTQSQPTIKTSSIETCYPTSVQEAGECFDYALGRGIYNITLTFNYNNQEELGDFFNNRIETRLSAPYIYNDYEWTKGSNKTNRIHLESDSKMATKSKDISQSGYSQYYYKNLKNAAYEIRHSKIQKRTDNHFLIDDVKKRLVVHNSETLFFALERGFRPEFIDSEIAVNGSLAQRAYFVYQEARSACAEAFGTETTNDFDKVRQLFEWLMNNTHYDHWIVSEAATEASDFWQWSSYFAEGVFLNNGIAVCDGFSKALAIMGGIEGLPIIRSAGFADAGGHAWNYYHHSDGNWYLICPTWAHDDNSGNQDFISYNFSITSYQPFMTQSNYFYKHVHDMYYNYLIEEERYTPIRAELVASKMAEESNFKEVLFTDITKSSTPYVPDIYKTDVFDPANNYDYHLDSNDEALALVNKIGSLNLNSSFSVDISYYNGCEDVVNYFLGQLRNKYGEDNVAFLLEYTYTHVEVVVKI